jgi:hypothetical protein
MHRFQRLRAHVRDLAGYLVALVLVALISGVALLAMGGQVSKILSATSGGI